MNKFKKIIYSKTTLYSSLGLMGVLSVGLITNIVLASQEAKKQYLEFDNKVFKNETTLKKYVEDNTEKNKFDFDKNNYVFNNQFFDTKTDLNKYLENKFPIQELKTGKNPGNYIINSSGELSSNVLMNDGEDYINVYKGKDNNAYLTKEEALKTYQTNYDEVYDINGSKRYSEYDAKQLIENGIKKNLEDENYSKQEVYFQGSYPQTKEQINSWIRDGIKTGFDYQGNIFSDYNYDDFKVNFSNLLTEQTKDKYIKKVVDADKKSYWFSHNKSKTNLGYYIGPKYVETTQDISTTKFETISSFTPSMFFNGAILNVFDASATTNFSNKEGASFDWNQNYVDDTYKKFLKEKCQVNISKENLSSFEDILKLKTTNHIWQDCTAGLGSIDSLEGMTDFDKFLIASKKIIQYSKIYSNSFADPNKLENTIKDICVDMIQNTNQKMMSLIKEENNSFDSDNFFKNLSFNDIYSLFLNSNSFYEEHQSQQDMLGFIQGLNGLIDRVCNVLKTVSDITDKVSNINKEYRKADKSDSALQDSRKDLKNSINEALKDPTNYKNCLEKLGIETNSEKALNYNLKAGVGLDPVSIACDVWDLSENLNFMSVKTMEFKIDENQSIYYVTPSFKIPLFDIEISSDSPDCPVTKLSDSAISYLLPSNEENENKIIYEFEGKYYAEKEDAENALVDEVYKTPEKFLQCKNLLVSIMDQQQTFQLPDEIVNAEIVDEVSGDNEMTMEEYSSKINEEKDKFVDQIFSKYFETQKKEYYLDGFGNYFDTKEEALESLNAKISSFELKPKYEYTTRNDKKIISDTKEELFNEISKKEIIDSKLIINTDLIKTSRYNSLNEQQKVNFDVFELNFYSDKKYFMSKMQAQNFIENNIDYKVLNISEELNSFKYDNNVFNSEVLFNDWVKNNTKEIRQTAVNGREII